MTNLRVDRPKVQDLIALTREEVESVLEALRVYSKVAENDPDLEQIMDEMHTASR
jgi:hypothetical protein